MSSLLLEKLGMVDQHASIEDCVNAIVKVLNQSKKTDPTVADTAIAPYGLNGVEFSGSYSFNITYGIGNNTQTFTLTHNFGSIPSGFIVTDLTFVPVGPLQSFPTIVRTSWTSTQITIKIGVYDATTSAGPTLVTGTFKILVLR